MARNDAAFTLVELATTLAVVGITLLAAIPAFATVMRNAQAASASHQLTVALATARMAAIDRGHAVTVCPSNDGSHCRRDSTWDAGWIVYLDPGRDPDPASVERVLEHSQRDGAISVRGSDGRRRVRYLPDGRASGSNTTLALCRRADGQSVGKVVINNAGRVRIERPDAPGTRCPFNL
ncbi:GspH/FimT family pseudopilin [Montanilutibacter psychrotolerans]|nr:GspH/FimT family pseudopilin [Lysobacter psychrotolerans]